MSNYYVDFTLGSDSNMGSETSPFKHPPGSNLDSGNSAIAAGTLAGGSTIYIKRGEIWENTRINIIRSGSVGNLITYDAYGVGDLPIISSNSYYTDTDFTGPDGNGEYYISTITVDPIKAWDGDTLLAEGTVGSLSSDEWGYDAANYRVYLKPSGAISNYTFNFGTQKGPYSIVADYIKLQNHIAEGGNNTSSGVIYALPFNYSVLQTITTKKQIVAGFRGLSGCTNNELYDMTVICDGMDGIRFDAGGNDNTLSRIAVTNTKKGITLDTSTDNDLSEINIQNYDIGIDMDSADGNTCTSCDIKNEGGYGSDPIGINLRGASTGNTITDNTISDSMIAGSTAIINFNDNTIHDNEIFNIATAGIDVKSGSPTIEGNDIHHVWNDVVYPTGEGTGILQQDGSTPSIQRNKVQGCYLGFTGGNTSVALYFNVFKDCLVNCVELNSVSPSESLFYNNTVIHNPDPAVITGNGHGLMLRTNAATKKAVIKNNIIYMESRMTGIDGLQIDDTTDDFTLSNNIYYEDNSIADGDLLHYNSTVYDADFPSWEVATGDTDSEIIDPLISSDGKLQVLSPCLDTAIAIAGVNDAGTLDLWGVPIVGKINIGADQSGLSTWTSPIVDYSGTFSPGSSLSLAWESDLPQAIGTIKFYRDRSYWNTPYANDWNIAYGDDWTKTYTEEAT